MSEKKAYEFFVVRYVPDVMRGEFVNVGLVMTEQGGDGGGFADAYFTQDWKRVEEFYPDSDVDLLAGIGRDIRQRVLEASSRALLNKIFEEQLSNAIQRGAVEVCLSADPEKEMEYLISTLVEVDARDAGPREQIEGARPKHETPRWGRKYLRSAMSSEFARKGIIEFMAQNLSGEFYGLKGFTLDFAYVAGKERRFLQAVSLVNMGDDTKFFPLRAAKIESMVPVHMEGDVAKFTAVVEDDIDADNNKVREILGFMEQEKIRVARLREMPAIAEEARLVLASGGRA